MLICLNCGLTLPAQARFCARCGSRLPGSPASPAALAPVWVLALLWLGSAATLGIAIVYAAYAIGLAPVEGLAPGVGAGALQVATGVMAACAASLFLAHLLAAIGLMRGRPWSRPLATLVCVTWGLTCVGLPVGLLAISAMWRPVPARAPGTASPRSSP